MLRYRHLAVLTERSPTGRLRPEPHAATRLRGRVLASLPAIAPSAAPLHPAVHGVAPDGAHPGVPGGSLHLHRGKYSLNTSVRQSDSQTEAVAVVQNRVSSMAVRTTSRTDDEDDRFEMERTVSTTSCTGTRDPSPRAAAMSRGTSSPSSVLRYPR